MRIYGTAEQLQENRPFSPTPGKENHMKTCSLHDFMAELAPWLDNDYIRSAALDDKGHLVIHFVDGMKNVYHLDDCTTEQVLHTLQKIKKRGVAV